MDLLALTVAYNDNDLLSDDDELIVQYLETPFFSRRVYNGSDLYSTLRDDEFLKRFRLSKRSATFLLEKIIHNFPNTFNRNAVSPMNQLLCTLRYYATGSQLTACGDVIGAHESTACRILHRVTHAIASLYSEYIKMPVTVDEQNNVVAKFYDIAKFPRCIGAIDCTHIKFLSPGGDYAEIYRNRKGYFSINTQCICSANLLFLDVVARWHGSVHDANIWDNCAQKRNFVQGVYNEKLLVGDSGYSQTRYMMTPLPENTPSTRGEKLYQESQIRTRNVIERTFGIWKRRFPILSKGINVKLRRVPGIIVATAVLHNIAILQKDSEPPTDEDIPHIPDIPIAIPTNSRTLSRSIAGNIERTLLINEYFARL
ncbi:putative nuclease HARBI1 [Colias croceus]|uniref:putative nuclease HARBI1 n=1 Tax=Colias crocea TaxID=72248 RepID=UPI001E27C13E|nr:putative nuclease HARBI1 [Colias croceus]